MNAFPLQTQDGQFDKGMELRDWFAGQALSGILATQTGVSESDIAITAYNYADAMLRYRTYNNRVKTGE